MMHALKRLLGRPQPHHDRPPRHESAREPVAEHPRLPLHVNFCWTLAGNVVYALCGWGMLMAIAKLGSAEQVGVYALGLAAVGPVIALFNLDLRTVQATDASKRFPFGVYLALRMATTSAALLLIAGMARTSLYRPGDAGVIVAAAVAAAVEALSDVLFGLFQQRERLDRIAISMIFKAPLGMGAMILAMLLTGSVVQGYLFVAITRAIVLVGYDIPSMLRIARGPAGQQSGPIWGRGMRPIWDARELGTLALLTLPLGLSTLLVSLNTNIPRYFVAHSLGNADLGIFCGMMYVMQIGVLLVVSVSYSASPLLARHYAAGRLRDFSLLLAKLVGIGLAIGAGSALLVELFGYEILLLLYTADFAEHADVFTWVAVAFAMGYAAEYLGIGMVSARYFAIQLPLQLLAAGTTTLGCLLFVPAYGLHGAAGAILLSKSVQALGGLCVCVYAVVRAARKRPASRPVAVEELAESRIAVELDESNTVYDLAVAGVPPYAALPDNRP